MTVSVRMNPLLENELEQAAKRQGVSKSQFVIDAVERALGRRNTYELMMTFKAEEPRGVYAVTDGVQSIEQPYSTESAKDIIQAKLKAKHGSSSAG
jgi:predicted DNA-binding protein